MGKAAAMPPTYITNITKLIMKKRTVINTAIACGAAVCFSLQSCENTETVKPAKISSIQADTLVALKAGDEASPKCKVSIDYMYLQPGDEKDSISSIINSKLQRIAFGEAYSDMKPGEAISSVVNKYVQNYQKELTKFYEADLHNGMKPEDIPAWYNYEYEITSELNLNNDSIWNFSVNTFKDTGGAHPNTTIKWANLLAKSGKVLTKELVFRKDKEKEIIDLILKHLIDEVNQRLETDTITSLEGLKENGALLDVDLYIPDNFMLLEDRVSFLYNRYDIAPYAMGEFIIDVPYAEIETMLNRD